MTENIYGIKAVKRINEFEERVARLKKLAPEMVASRPEEQQLPFWPEPQRAIPNALLTSALFGSARRRRWVQKRTIASWPDTEIQFTGETLNQFDETVWLQLAHEHRVQNTPSDGRVYINGRGMLREMGNTHTGNSHTRLHDSIRRLVACLITLKHKGCEYGSSLLTNYKFDEARGRYWIQINPEFIRLFGTGFTRFDWETRKKLSTGLSSWVHRYCERHKATPKHPHRIGLERLRDISGMSSSPKEFKRTLKGSMEQLKTHGVVSTWRITPNNALEYVRPRRTKRESRSK